MPPADPKRLTALDRIVTVLEAIEAGSSYFYTPHMVKKILLDHSKAKYGNLYSVLPDSGDGLAFAGTQLFDEPMKIIIHGIAYDSTDVGGKLLKSTLDIRKAIILDFRSGQPDTLSTICADIDIFESPEFYYFDEVPKFGFFDQPVAVKVSGDLTEL